MYRRLLFIFVNILYCMAVGDPMNDKERNQGIKVRQTLATNMMRPASISVINNSSAS